MTDKKISELDPASTLTGAEQVPVVQSGSTVRTTIAAIGASVTPGGSNTEIQYNDSGSFAGDADLTWIAGTGLLNKRHLGVGNHSGFDGSGFSTADWAPGDATNTFATADPSSLSINDFFDNTDFAGVGYAATGLRIFNNWKQTTHAGQSIYVIHNECTIGSDSTNTITEFIGDFGATYNYGSGNVSFQAGLDFAASHHGSGTVTNLVGCQAFVNSAGAGGAITNAYAFRAIGSSVGKTTTNQYQAYLAKPGGAGTITNLYGLYIEDMSGRGSTTSYNIKSAGSSSQNVFEGRSSFGYSAAWPSVPYGTGTAYAGTYSYPYGVAISNDFGNTATFNNGLVVWPAQKNTSGSPLGLQGIDVEPVVESNVFVNGVTGIFVSPILLGSGDSYGASGITDNAYSYSSGAVTSVNGFYGSANHGGTGTLGTLAGLSYGCFMYSGAGAVTDAIVVDAQSISKHASVTLTNAIGIRVQDQSGAGATTKNYNIESLGANSVNVFEGHIDGQGRLKSSSASAGVGYATGAGGTVTQATSRTTGVTLNKTTGAVTLVSAAGSTSWQTFTVTNSAVAATDTIIVNQQSGTDKNMIFVTAVAAGSFDISFATTGGTTTEQPVFLFAVIKAVTS